MKNCRRLYCRLIKNEYTCKSHTLHVYVYTRLSRRVLQFAQNMRWQATDRPHTHNKLNVWRIKAISQKILFILWTGLEVITYSIYARSGLHECVKISHFKSSRKYKTLFQPQTDNIYGLIYMYVVWILYSIQTTYIRSYYLSGAEIIFLSYCKAHIMRHFKMASRG